MQLNPARRRLLLGLLGVTLGSPLVLLPGCSKSLPRGQIVARGETVLALGDSITFGTGATAETSYPAVLAGATGWSVINAGVPGNTSAQALQRLPDLLEEHKPKLVLVSIGGNDFLRRQAEAATRENIKAICQKSLAAGAQVILIAVPELSLSAVVARSLSDHDLYEDISKELKLPLHSNGWSKVLGDASLRADNIHANAEGYKRFAEGLAATARKSGLL